MRRRGSECRYWYEGIRLGDRESKALALAIATDLAEVKTEARVFQARTEERFNRIDQRFNSVDQRLGSLEDRTKAQDSRLWTFVTDLVLAALGTIAKLAFFPSA